MIAGAIPNERKYSNWRRRLTFRARLRSPVGVARAFQLMNLFESMTVEENVMVAPIGTIALGCWQALSLLRIRLA